MNDNILVALRAVLMVGGGFLAGRGKMTSDQVGPIVDQLISAASALVGIGSGLWALWVRWNTRAVPASVGARLDVPTVSAATGAVQP